ncbi:hypothetical protein HPP92_005939 [Vanilla planifolia]|uniref:Ubiquitin-like protease family profile domain-containing protein n=1 Tax=Vanilla planifolia TaxID=51239 RepID=A0A835RMB6_VANPL|nr:hypothetical protein HPP92_005939 [Vanilla planifolia]
MRNSSKELSVFSFEAEESNEEAEKLSNYQFLQACNHYLKQSDVTDLPHIDLDGTDSPQKSSSERTATSTEDKFELDAAMACAISCHNQATMCTSSCRSGSPVQDDDLVLVPSRILVPSVYEDEETEPHFSEISLNLMSDDEESCDSLSETSSISGDLLETEDRPGCLILENANLACGAMDEDGKTVTVYPDYVTYGDKLFLECRLTFCCDCINIECSDATGADEKLILECDINNVFRIACHWSRSVEALLIKFWIRVDVRHGSEKLLASVTDMCWWEKEQKIKSLAERYNAIWDTMVHNDSMLVDDVPRNSVSFSKQFFAGTVEPFEDVIYPKGDPDAVSICKRDVELLEPDTFINDTIIDFYIKYLQDKIQSNDKNRFHFFNSFFFRKLADLDKDPGSISEGRAAFQRVRKWTRKVDIFEKDYIFIPVNFNLHWSLLVICHPGEIPTFKDDALTKSTKVPCILHMDSIKGSHSGLKNLIQSYLLEEWKERHTVLEDNISSKFLNLRFVPLELPQQENSSDCGLFLLHYVELFLEGAPICFNPSQITKLSSFLTVDWFPPAEASFKRFYIRGLLYEILRDSAPGLTLTCSNGEFPCSDDVDQAAHCLPSKSSSSNTVDGSTSMSSVDQDNSLGKMEILQSSPVTYSTEVHGDDKAHASELLVEDNKSSRGQPQLAVSKEGEDLQPSFGSSLSHFCSTSSSVDDVESCQTTLISKEEMEEAVDFSPSSSNGHLAISIERDATHKIEPFAFAPDTPDTRSYDQKQEELEKESLEDDHGHGSKLLAISRTGTKRRREDTSMEPKSDQIEHYHESIPSTEEALSGEHCPEIDILEQEEGEPNKNKDINKASEQNHGACKEELLSENSIAALETSVKKKGILIKRSEISGSEQACKRHKVVRFDIERRVTRSSSKEMPS